MDLKFDLLVFCIKKKEMEEELVVDIGDDMVEKMEESNAANVDDIGHKVDDLFAKVEKVKHRSCLT